MNISINKSQIPLWSGATGSLQVDAQGLSPNAPVTPTDTALFNASFQINDNVSAISLGQNDSVSLGVKAGTTAKLAALFQNHTGAAPDLVKQYSLQDSLGSNNLLLAFQLGGNADLSVAASFQYSVLTAGATLQTGVNGGLVAVKSFPLTENLGPMLQAFFQNLQLPGNITQAPAPGELTVLEFGGYLQLGASVSAGYQVKGTKAFNIADLALSEHYGLSVLGKFAVTGRIAGQFSVQVRTGKLPGWANVRVHRDRTKTLQVAADATLDASLQTDGLPTSSLEFLGSILGVQAKNWINLITSGIDQASQVTSLDALKSKLDGLAGDFISKWLGKGIDQITSQPDIQAALAKVQAIVTSYQNLDNSAITLFDRYFDPLVSQIDALTQKLNLLKGLQGSWAALPSEVDTVLWNVLRQLTAGDPLGAILNGPAGLTSVQGLADQALALIQNDAHAEIRKVIELAKTEFHLDDLFNQLSAVDTPDKLKASVDTMAAHFASRVIGQVIDKNLSAGQFKQIANVIQKIEAGKNTIVAKLDAILQDAAKQTLNAKLHAEYNAAETTDALIDCDLNLNTAAGRNLMKAAGRGDYTTILSQYQPTVVLLNQGTLTHNLTKSSSLSVNVVGWHFNFKYSSMDKLITNTEQQIKASSDGSLLISTDTSVNIQSDTDRNASTPREQEIRTNFLLRYLGQTRSVINDKKFDPATKQYFIDVITGRSAVYTVNITDATTTPAELTDLFSFAKQIGLDSVGATVASMTPLLQLNNGNFGKVDAQYEVQYTEDGLSRLLQGDTSPLPAIRPILEAIVMASYSRSSVFLHDVAVAFCSPGAAKAFEQNPVQFFNPGPQASMTFSDIPASPIPGMTLPTTVNLTQNIQIVDLGNLFQSLLSMVSAVGNLRDALSGSPGPAAAFEKKLQDFGAALQAFQNTSMNKNAVFAVFDQLIELTTPAPRARSSAMQVTFTRDGSQKTVLFTLAAETGAVSAVAQ